MSSRRALLFINPKASQAGNTYEDVAQLLQAAGFEIHKGDAQHPQDYARITQEFADKVDLVIVGGGDGTLRCAMEALLTSAIPVGIIPLGTANNVARSLGIPLDWRKACEVIIQGRSTQMDLAKVNDRLFVSVVGIGFSTQVHEEVPDHHKKKYGALSYAFHALRVLFTKRQAFRVFVKYDQKELTTRALQVTVCNGKYYGAQIEVARDATLVDGQLHLSIVEAKKFIHGIAKILLPSHADHRSAGLKLIPATEFEISTQPIMKLDVEGETDLRTPAVFRILPKAIRVMVP